METKQLNLIRAQVEVILRESEKLRGKNLSLYKESHVEYLYYLRMINHLTEQLNRLAPKMNTFFKKEGINYKIEKLVLFDVTLEKIRENRTLFGAEPRLLKLILASTNILAIIKQDIILPEKTQNKLDSLSDEINNLRGKIPEDLYINLVHSKETFEKGCLLGSSLISGKIIRVCLDKVNGKDINEKIESLKKIDLDIDKGGKDSLIKANHFARNLWSHDLSIIPTPSETISHLGESVKISKIVHNYIDLKSTQEEK